MYQAVHVDNINNSLNNSFEATKVLGLPLIIFIKFFPSTLIMYLDYKNFNLTIDILLPLRVYNKYNMISW